MSAKIKSVFYNFHQVGDHESGFYADGDYDEIGRKKNNKGKHPTEILEYDATEPEGKHHVTIKYSDGSRKKVFNIAEIYYFKN